MQESVTLVSQGTTGLSTWQVRSKLCDFILFLYVWILKTSFFFLQTQTNLHVHFFSKCFLWSYLLLTLLLIFICFLFNNFYSCHTFFHLQHMLTKAKIQIYFVPLFMGGCNLVSIASFLKGCPAPGRVGPRKSRCVHR